MTTQIPLPTRTRLEGHLEFDADKKALFLRESGEIISGLSMLHQMVSKDRPVDRDMARNILSLTDIRNAEICNFLGIELDTQEERESRFAHMRALNDRVRELEAQLGRSGSIEQTTEHIKLMATLLNRWWRKDGFGHVSEIEFSQYGAVKIDLSCMMFGDFRLIGSTKPVTDKLSKEQWHVSLRDRGFALATPPNERDPSLVDNDHNRFVLKSMILEALPSARIIGTKNHFGHQVDWATLDAIQVHVSDLADVMRLQDRFGGDPSQD